MKTSFPRLAIIAPAFALVLMGVASVAFALGVSSGDGATPPSAVPAASAAIARPTTPGNPPRVGGARQSVVFGTVASKTDAAIVVTTTGNSSVTINVTASTTYSNGTRTAATLADVTVGATIVAQGTLNSDGSLNATVVQTGINRLPSTGGFPGGGSGSGGFPGGGRSGGRGGASSPAPAGSGAAPGTY